MRPHPSGSGHSQRLTKIGTAALVDRATSQSTRSASREAIRLESQSVDAGSIRIAACSTAAPGRPRRRWSDAAEDKPAWARGLAASPAARRLIDSTWSFPAKSRQPAAIRAERVGQDRVGAGRHVAAMDGQDVVRAAQVPDRRIIACQVEPQRHRAAYPCAASKTSGPRFRASKNDDSALVAGQRRSLPWRKRAPRMVCARIIHVFFVRLRYRVLTRTRNRFSSSVRAERPSRCSFSRISSIRRSSAASRAIAALAAQLGAAAAPAFERTFPVRTDLGRAALQARVALGKIVAEDAVLEIAAVLEHPRLDSHQELDQHGQADQRQSVQDRG